MSRQKGDFLMVITLEELLIKAQQKQASDLHISVGIPPKVRVHGELVPLDYPEMTPQDTKEIIEPILSDKIIDTLAMEGEADFSYAIKGIGRFRVNVFKQRGSYALVIRLVATEIPPAKDLGIPSTVIDLTTKKRGLVLVTGPTGSGKSTTLASMLDIINSTRNEHIITLEDPIEYIHKHKKAIVNQREVGIDTNSYSKALRAALREDPDVILVGEMRDLDTISIAITAAETGHLVFSTLHTTGSANTIERIIDVFPSEQQQQIRVQLSNVLESVISQLLIPTKDGKGRVAAYEVMHGTPAIRNLIRESKTHQINSMIQTSKKMGMQLMDDALYELYLSGKIDADQAINFAQDENQMERRLF